MECNKGYYHTLLRSATETPPMTTQLSTREQLPAPLFTPTPPGRQAHAGVFHRPDQQPPHPPLACSLTPIHAPTPRAVHTGEGITDRNQLAALPLHALFSHAPRTKDYRKRALPQSFDGDYGDSLAETNWCT